MQCSFSFPAQASQVPWWTFLSRSVVGNETPASRPPKETTSVWITMKPEVSNRGPGESVHGRAGIVLCLGICHHPQLPARGAGGEGKNTIDMEAWRRLGSTVTQL